MAKFSETERQKIARDAFRYDAQSEMNFCRERKNIPCCYGKLIKYLMFLRGFSYSTFSEMIDLTPQALNHRLNIQKPKNYRQSEIKEYCEKLKFDEEDFYAISDMIKVLEETYGKR